MIEHDNVERMYFVNKEVEELEKENTELVKINDQNVIFLVSYHIFAVGT